MSSGKIVADLIGAAEAPIMRPVPVERRRTPRPAMVTPVSVPRPAGAWADGRGS
jgi:hypothetical protein